jgi:hypothetical protein
MATPPELQQLLSESVNRTKYQNPLFQAVTQMAYGGLPTYAREGTSLGQLGPAAPIQPQQGDSDLLKMLGAGGIGAALGGLGSGGGGPLGALIQGLKKLFGGGGGVSPTVQGDQPYGGGALMGGGQGAPGFEGWDVNGPPMLPSDPGFWTNWNGMPNDPSGGTGVGPGMQGYYGATGDHGPDDYWNHP